MRRRRKTYIIRSNCRSIFWGSCIGLSSCCCICDPGKEAGELILQDSRTDSIQNTFEPADAIQLVLPAHVQKKNGRDYLNKLDSGAAFMFLHYPYPNYVDLY